MPLEGSIFIAGAVVQWLRDGIGLITSADQSRLACRVLRIPGQDVYLVPAFTGLGAPYWDAECRGAIFGLTRNSGPAEFARAALESVAFQTRDLAEAMKADMPDAGETVLRVDGGMTASEWTMQGDCRPARCTGRRACRHRNHGIGRCVPGRIAGRYRSRARETLLPDGGSTRDLSRSPPMPKGNPGIRDGRTPLRGPLSDRTS